MNKRDDTEESFRILAAYRRREERSSARSKLFVYEDWAQMYRVQDRHKRTLQLLSSFGVTSLQTLHILDIGCGDGNWLRQVIQWGAQP